MNKSAIQKFAIQARRDLIEQVKQRAYQYGIDETGFGDINAVAVSGRVLSSAEKLQRQELIRQIQQKGYAQEMEEVAYTWFNRFIALRFMEVNNYLPSHIRVFSDASGSFSPEILKDALHLDLPGLDKGKVAEYIESNSTDDLYRYLLLTQCNALNEALPVMFQRMGSYTEMLLPNNILRPDSVLGHMVTDIPEKDWKDQVQIIGWMYQYYNTEPKQAVFDGLKKNIKITKDTIPAATQLFTPDWIVRYMVENSLGRLWTEGHPNAELRAGWKYYLDEAKQEPEVEAQLAKIREEYQTIKPEEVKVIDPCMGSGHILVYAFDVLMQIYQSAGWDQREAAQSILEHNLYGLDIDDRAAQLAYFAVMMKARQYDRRIFTRGIQPHVYAIQDSNGITTAPMHDMGLQLTQEEYDPAVKQALRLVEEFHDAKEYGSILSISPCDWTLLRRFAIARTEGEGGQLVFGIHGEQVAAPRLQELVNIGEILSQKYDVVVTNPPYMGSSGMGTKLGEYVKKNYPDSKSDLFAVFIERCGQMTAQNRYQAMITQHAWMFLSSFEKLRAKLLQMDTVNMAHLGARAFDEIGGEVVQTTSFVIRKSHVQGCKGVYCRLIEPTSQNDKEDMFLAQENRYESAQDNFSKIPGSPIAYWLGVATANAFSYNGLGDIAEPRMGLTTGNNERYLRFWFEVALNRIGIDFSRDDALHSGMKWFPYNKGGNYRKWYGNREYVVDWENDGHEMQTTLHPDGTRIWAHNFNLEYNFREHLTWNDLTSGSLSFRLFENGFLFDSSAAVAFVPHSLRYYLLGYLNTKFVNRISKLLNPTMHFKLGDFMKIPFLLTESHEKVGSFAQDCVGISKKDWDSFETSWDFKRHPLIYDPDQKRTDEKSPLAASRQKIYGTIQWHFERWESKCNARFRELKANEEELNRVFIDIYGLQDELTPEVEDKDITVRKADLGRDIRSLISYAVGCMFGRYSLDVEGLAYAGGDWDDSKYSTFTPDRDNVIPICDDEYFDDDITGRFVQWVETVYGKETLEENLKFIADALGGKGSPREVIRSYFLNDFYADHLKVYQKRPIYWLFDSGKKNGFKALIYMHRYQRDLLARMRTDYVHEQQERYRTQLTQIGDALTHASGSEAVKLSKQQKKIQEQSLEIQKYEEKIHHLADQNIEIDLDDGVKHNYALFEDVLAKIK